MKRTILVFLLALMILAGCGGGGGSGSAEITTPESFNTAPVASAGPDRNGAVGSLVTLAGIGTDVDGDQLTYNWSFNSMPAGSLATLTFDFDFNSMEFDYANPKFMPDVAGKYILNLVVNDGKVNSFPVMVNVTVEEPTHIAGILASDTTLTKDNSPYFINGNLQVPNGITLTIEPGVYLFGQGITVWGTMNAIGTSDNKIIFNNVFIEHGFNAVDSVLSIKFSDISIINKSSFSQSNATVSVSDSVIRSTGNYIKISESKHDSFIERNTLINTSIVIADSASPVSIKNNNFIGDSHVFFHCSNSPVYVERNSFLTKETTVIKLPDYCNVSNMQISNNYWGTDDKKIIDGMIFDSKDYFGISTTIDYMPILNEADVNTPDPTKYLSQ